MDVFGQDHTGYEPQTALVNGHRLEIEEVYEILGPNEPQVIRVILTGHEPAALLTVGSRVKVQLFDSSPASYRVTAVREGADPSPLRDRSGAVYTVELTQVLRDEDDDTVEVLYRTTLMTILARTQIRAIGDLLEAKGLTTAAELRRYVDEAVRTSFLDIALNIVAEEGAEAMLDTVLHQLDADAIQVGAKEQAAS